jgi:hypothetical protein
MSNHWDRTLWAIEFSSPKCAPMLIGTPWCNSRYAKWHIDEPSRALLFFKRSMARTWCKKNHAKYAGWLNGCADWRFRPVKVREMVVKL